MTVGRWHAKHRGTIIQGDVLVEIRADGVQIDLPAPYGGKLHRRCVLPDEPVRAGQRVAIIDYDASTDD
jgi:pyruvate/2-oxoglutarate dehydrogenase complex dihydrolipoamide acyltransferase (E2) component